MAYDNYENTSFDLDHDGHIDTNEAAYIHDTFYGESDASDEDMDFSIEGGYRSSNKRYSCDDIDYKKLAEDVKRDDMRKSLIAIGLVIIAAIAFESSPGVVIFLGGILLSAKISGVF